ncbi:hypothetical protein [Pseudomonas monteilii]|uniref:hypothetical protein n=1 Tax=Pseudomonas monteilii TaxID=76759 RepID=UPI0018A65AE1|nr:hypothetical protein [Pseudomonas monteilii]BBV99906.1 hypothetical protein STW0522PSE72_P10160 [Pseudomonas monteilii]BBV99974.1 hypothetical protein STW0522PSE72_P10840 [Pseudomonas monteilii]
MAQRQKYTVLIPFPLAGGHWSSVGQELDLMDVQAQQLEAVGRIKLTSAIEPVSAAAAAPAKKITTKEA